VSLHNQCSESITVVIHYKALNNMWVTEGWWKVEPGKILRTDVVTRNRIVYFYAKSDSFTWDGDDEEGTIEKTVISNKFTRIGSDSIEGENLREVSLFKEDLGEDPSDPVIFTCDE